MIELTPDYTLLVIVAIFIVNYLIVKRWLVQPINGVLEWRADRTREADQKYEEALTRLHAATEQIEDRLMEAKREASDVRERYRREAGQRRDERVRKTREEAEARVREAIEKLDRDVAVARESIRDESEQLARFAAEQILGRKLA
ncbi:MAG: ATP synthase F0 subunit B [Thermoanaerobaculia bacterium]|nr:ATP synthase F0 subunit B [Thermoanaerobaculia bacterium]